MKEEEIEEQAKEYYEDNECYSYLSEVEEFEEVLDFVKDRVTQAFQDGAKWGMEHAIEWHDLKENPNALPSKEKSYKNISKVVLNVGGDKVFYDYLDNKWKYYYSETEVDVIAWCELPKFKE